MQKIYELKIFQWVEKDVIDAVLENSEKENYHPWDTILQQWDESNGKWYIITSGEVDIIIDQNYRTTLSNGDIFWEIALLNEEQRTATVVAKTDLEVIILTQDHLFELINNGNYSINADIMNRIEENLKIN
jgi:CRP-like cAMP-binding protein